jgi:hypothetical protein
MAVMNIRWWDWFPFQSWRVVEIVADADDVAQRLPRNGISLVGGGGTLKWLVFDCPCQSGHRIMLNVDPARKPFWRVHVSGRRRVTVMPSVDYSDPAKRCHYFVRRGRIIWAKSLID